MLQRSVQKASKHVPEDADMDVMDSELLHMWEARSSLQERWKAAAASTAKSFCIEALLARDSGRATPASKSPGSCSEGDAASPPPSSIPVSVAAVVASQAAGRLLGAIPGYHPVLQAGHPLYGLQAAGGGLPAGALPGLLPGSAFHPTLTEHGIKSHVSLDWLARTAGFYQRPGDVMSG
ncbi:hypothetical protein HPB51_006728 [Rhipicephalus microplus]|uniref:Uncharacterized protein n=1 Tax=Rhipicephalus microplus TaxID=6941 RepID=A0A9J6E871_RHIMP|nr:hypothetical protein HPB51_006728 [Rhipicephalus microplus]